MRVKDETAWRRAVEINQPDEEDPVGYGAAVMSYAERWADLMEERMAGGAVLADIARKTSHEADTEGITGFMYGAAAATLAKHWEHGEELRRWHNIDTQLGSEGVAANRSGGVLNPALVMPSLPEQGDEATR